MFIEKQFTKLKEGLKTLEEKASKKALKAAAKPKVVIIDEQKPIIIIHPKVESVQEKPKETNISRQVPKPERKLSDPPKIVQPLPNQSTASVIPPPTKPTFNSVQTKKPDQTVSQNPKQSDSPPPNPKESQNPGSVQSESIVEEIVKSIKSNKINIPKEKEKEPPSPPRKWTRILSAIFLVGVIGYSIKKAISFVRNWFKN